MKEEIKIWEEQVLNSMKASTRAKPSPQLWKEIKSNVSLNQPRLVSLFYSRITAAAAMILLVLNGFVLYQYSNESLSQGQSELAMDDSSMNLISNYNVYE